MAQVMYWGTGRRKKAIARVRLGYLPALAFTQQNDDQRGLQQYNRNKE